MEQYGGDENLDVTIDGGEVMSMMTMGNDGICDGLSGDLLAQVVNKLLTDGQLEGNAGQTYIIRQEGADDIQIQAGDITDAKSENKAAHLQLLSEDQNGVNYVGHDEQQQQGQQLVMINNGIIEGSHILTDDGQVLEQNQILTGMNQSFSTDDILRNAQVVDEQGQLIHGGNEILDEVRQIVNGENVEQKKTAVAVDNFIQPLNMNGNGCIQSNILTTLANSPFSLRPSFASMTSPNTGPHFVSSSTSNAIISSNLPIASSNISIPKVINSRSIIKPKFEDPVSIKVKTKANKPSCEKFLQPEVKNTSVVRISTNTTLPYSCASCGTGLLSELALYNHKKLCPSTVVKESSQIKGFQCPFCYKSFENRLNLLRHTSSCKKKQSVNIRPKSTYNKYRVISPISSDSLFQLDSMNKLNSLKSKKKVNELGIVKKKINLNRSKGRNIQKKEFNDSSENVDDFDIARIKSQKHLGPLVTNGVFKCRDCDRTFSKEPQYSRHINACRKAPLNTYRIDNDSPSPEPIDKRRKIQPPISLNKCEKTKNITFTADDDDDDDEFIDFLRPDMENEFFAKLKDGKGCSRNKEPEATIKESLKSIAKTQSKNMLKAKPTNNKNLKKTSIKETTSDVSNATDALKTETEKVVPKEKDYVCGLCNDDCLSEIELKIHIQMCHCQDIYFVQSILNGHESNATHKCPICCLCYFTLDSMLLHMAVVHHDQLNGIYLSHNENKNTFVCPWCDCLSKTKNLLEEHLATKHIDQMTSSPVESDEESELLKDDFLDLYSDSEKTSCLKCGTFIDKNLFESHQDKCRKVKYNIACPFDNCDKIRFSKLVNFVNHLQKCHDHEQEKENKEFSSMSDFMSWLHTLESKHKVKFFKAYENKKRNVLCSTWLCCRFNNDNSLTISKETSCFARIMTEVHLDKKTAKYDGCTTISYYADHSHSNVISTNKRGVKRKFSDISTSQKKENSSVISINIPGHDVNVDPEGFIVLDSDAIDALLQTKPSNDSEEIKENGVSHGEDSPELFNVLQEPSSSENVESESQENTATIVLPANEEEWKKMFELIHVQLDSNIYNESEILEAKNVLLMEDLIEDIGLNNQLDIFEKLCKLANVEFD